MNTISDQQVHITNPTYAYIAAFFEELQRAGVRDVVLCPGSRSTPLAIVSAVQPGLRLWRHIDERSAAFFALGIAKRSQAPVALICTSGTAAANFLPALVEAKLSCIPLLALTADRPHELRDCGAPQTIDQIQLFGSHVKWFVDLAPPEPAETLMQYIRTTAHRAVALSLAIPAGPVHLNFPLREPLVPVASAEYPLPPLQSRQTVAWLGRPDMAPYVAVSNASLAPPSIPVLAQLAERLHRVTRSLIIVGPQNNQALADTLLPLAQQLQSPILADPLSQLRGINNDVIITSYDAFLRVKNTLETPEYIIRIGAMPTSKPILLYLNQHHSCPQLVLNEQNVWEEPTQLASEFISTDLTAFCQRLRDILDEAGYSRESEKRLDWLRSWQNTDQVTQQTLSAAIQDFSEPFEGRIFTELAAQLSPKTTLFVGNSMPVRDLDTFFWYRQGRIRLMGNRGANGIDGLISSALGASVATDADEPTLLVIGDLSFLHDLNGLLAAHLQRLHLVIILVNNDGGGIFSFLPQAAYPAYFEHLFGVPLGLDFQQIKPFYGVEMHHIQTWEQFRTHLQAGLHGEGIHILEVRTERESNVRMHRQLWRLVEQALAHHQSLLDSNCKGMSR